MTTNFSTSQLICSRHSAIRIGDSVGVVHSEKNYIAPSEAIRSQHLVLGLFTRKFHYPRILSHRATLRLARENASLTGNTTARLFDLQLMAITPATVRRLPSENTHQATWVYDDISIRLISLLPFGLALLTISERVQSPRPFGPDDISNAFATTILLLVSFAILLVNKIISFNKQDGTIKSGFRVFGLGREKTQMLDDFDLVTLHLKVSNSTENTTYTWEVRLGGITKSLLFSGQKSYTAARKLAEELSFFLGFPFEDRTGKKPVRRQSDLLDESVGDRAQRLNEEPELVVAPTTPKSLITILGKELTLNLPAQRLSGRLVFYLVLQSCAYLVWPTWIIYREITTDGGGGLFWHRVNYGLWASVILLVVLAIVRPVSTLLDALLASVQRQNIFVSPTQIHVQARGLIRSITEIPLDQIEEFELLADEIRLRTDTSTVYITAAMPHDELHYIHGLIFSRLKAAAPPRSQD